MEPLILESSISMSLISGVLDLESNPNTSLKDLSLLADRDLRVAAVLKALQA